LCNLADEIAYNAHDIDDGIRSGLITLAQLAHVELFERYRTEAVAQHPHLLSAPRRLLYETIRRMLSAQVYDVIHATNAAIQAADVHTVNDVRNARPLVLFGDEMCALSKDLKHFLLHQLYRHPQVMETTQHAQGMVAVLFEAYMTHPNEMQAGYVARLAAGIQGNSDEADAIRARVVADYIAGMTDRFATREHARLSAGKA
jgi:dGTPase